MSEATSLEIQPLEPQHREQVRELHARCFPGGQALEDLVLDRLFSHPRAINLVALQGDEPVGFVACLHGTGPRARILTIHTAPEARGQGIAARLLGELERRLMARQARFLELEVHIDNEPAIALYRSAGFQVNREDPPAYPKRDEPAGFVMRKQLAP